MGDYGYPVGLDVAAVLAKADGGWSAQAAGGRAELAPGSSGTAAP